MDEEGFFYSFIIKSVPPLPEREDLTRRLDDIGLHDLGIPEKLSALQRIFE
jgi:hypothetical protein